LHSVGLTLSRLEDIYSSVFSISLLSTIILWTDWIRECVCLFVDVCVCVCLCLCGEEHISILTHTHTHIVLTFISFQHTRNNTYVYSHSHTLSLTHTHTRLSTHSSIHALARIYTRTLAVSFMQWQTSPASFPIYSNFSIVIS